MKSEVTIGITDCSKYPNYAQWIEREEGARVVKLSPSLNNLKDISKCDGILLTGGEDVHPRFYKMESFLEQCNEVDEKRDDFEWKVLEQVEKKNLPLLGICRGLQMANVYFGGTLIPDIPSFGKFDHSKWGETDRYHVVHVDPHSQLQKIVGLASGEINSAHHQSADKVGRGLVVSALSPDGIVEAMERKNPKGQPFLLLVQWHPERMKDQGNVFSKSVRKNFLEAVAATKS